MTSSAAGMTSSAAGAGESSAGTTGSHAGMPGSGASGGASSNGGSGPSAGRGGTGGSATAGSGNNAGSGSTGTPNPSAGCGTANKPARVSEAMTQIIDFPSSYDGLKPFPLLIALHACGNDNNQWEKMMSDRKATELEDGYVRLMPNTTNSDKCWQQGSDSANSTRVLQQLDNVLAKYCIDKNRVFAVGHSSGAQFLVRMLANKTTFQHLNLKAVAPVAGDPAAVAAPIPVLYIDGQKDTQRGATSAKDTVAKFRTANMCADTSMPYTQIMGCKSNQNQAQVDPGCIIYDKCTVPTIWCSHNDPDYGSTEHGVPCFGLPAITDFFKSL